MKVEPQIPDLANLRNISGWYALRRFFTGAGPREWDQYALVVNFIRLVDLARDEYQNGRARVYDFWNPEKGRALAGMARASGHFESCVSTLQRAIRYLEIIRGYPSFPKSVKDLVPDSLQVLQDETKRKIRKLRNAIQHLEGEIKRGAVKKGDALFLAPGQERVELGCHYILYSDLAKWISESHECSSKLCDHFASASSISSKT